jgi:hypothetical protein
MTSADRGPMSSPCRTGAGQRTGAEGGETDLFVVSDRAVFELLNLVHDELA